MDFLESNYNFIKDFQGNDIFLNGKKMEIDGKKIIKIFKMSFEFLILFCQKSQENIQAVMKSLNLLKKYLEINELG